MYGDGARPAPAGRRPRFDLLVVGAGIYGALAAWDAAQRGLRVALIDRGDFGGGTSFNSLKTLHGGLRSLQALSLPQMRLFIRERRAMARIAAAPGAAAALLRPDLRATSPAAALALRAALAVTDAVGARPQRRHRRPGAAACPAAGSSRATSACALNPLVDPAGVTGGAVWYDYQMRQTERVDAGVRAVGGGRRRGGRQLRRGRGAAARTAAAVDRRHGRGSPRPASASTSGPRAVLNAAGPWAGRAAPALLGAAAPRRRRRGCRGR